MGRPGQLKRRVEIKRPTVVTDILGGAEVTENSLGFFYAGINKGKGSFASKGSRNLENEQTAFERPYIVTMRQNIDILENDLILFESQVLVVQSIERDFDKYKYQIITAISKFS